MGSTGHSCPGRPLWGGVTRWVSETPKSAFPKGGSLRIQCKKSLINKRMGKCSAVLNSAGSFPIGLVRAFNLLMCMGESLNEEEENVELSTTCDQKRLWICVAAHM